MQPAQKERYKDLCQDRFQLVSFICINFYQLVGLTWDSVLQKEYILAKPAREAGAKAKLGVEALLNTDNISPSTC